MRSYGQSKKVETKVKVPDKNTKAAAGDKAGDGNGKTRT